MLLLAAQPRPAVASDKVQDAVTAELNRLLPKPPTAPLIPATALRARDAIRRGDDAAAEAIIRDILHHSRMESWRYTPFTAFMGHIADLRDPKFVAGLNAWVAHATSDPIPLLVRAQYNYQLGWLRRGHDFAADIQAKDKTAFQHCMQQALADINASLLLSDDLPYSWYLKLLILRGYGITADMAGTFWQAISKYPDYYDLYKIALETSQPRWGGSLAAMYRFVDKYAGYVAPDSPLKLLYLDLYRYVLATASVDCQIYLPDQVRMAQCVGSVMDKAAPIELQDRTAAFLHTYDQVDRYQFTIAVGAILQGMLQTAGGGVYAGELLQQAATAMHSNTQLEETAPHHNNYMIDRLVAESWFYKGFYDNAWAKAREAITDLATAPFPNQDAKNQAIAGIYLLMVRIASQLYHYVDVIAYEKAAVALGGDNGYEHFICWAYDQLADYPAAIRECSSIIGSGSGNTKAYYWRAMTERDAGKLDAALADLQTVARSEDDSRSYSVITMSMIYFKRHDIAGALRVLNEYPYIYDPRLTSRSNVAVAYNNRCYARMQLGQLERALDDCTASLKYGSLPDAFSKRQELAKRLAERGLHQ